MSFSIQSVCALGLKFIGHLIVLSLKFYFLGGKYRFILTNKLASSSVEERETLALDVGGSNPPSPAKEIKL